MRTEPEASMRAADGRIRISGVSGGRCDLGAAHGSDQGAYAEAQVILGDVEGRDEADGLVMDPTGDQKDIAFEGAGDRGLGSGLGIEFDRAPRTGPEDIPAA